MARTASPNIGTWPDVAAAEEGRRVARGLPSGSVRAEGDDELKALRPACRMALDSFADYDMRLTSPGMCA
jgi:hypothetical protein